MLRYGSDRPDRRLGTEIVDLTEIFRGSELKVFSGAIESGGVVRASRRAASSRAAASTTSRGEGAGPSAPRDSCGGRWKTAAGSRRGQVPERRRDVRRDRRRFGAGAGDAFLIVADQAAVAAEVLGELRVAVADTGPEGDDLLGRRLPDVRVERGREPLGPAPSSLHLADGRPRERPGHVAEPRVRRRLERLGARGGSIRISHPDVQQKVFDALGIAEDEASASASCSRRSATARRRTAGSRSGSTAGSP